MSAILNPASQPPAPHEVPPPQKVAAPPPPPRRTWLWVGLGAAVAAGIGLWQWNARREEARQTVVVTPIRTAKIVQGPLKTTRRLGGQTSAREFTNITAPRLVGPESNRPLVVQKLVPSGTMVKKGEIIVVIDGQSLQDHVDDVTSTLFQSESDLKKRKAEQDVEASNLQQTAKVANASLQKMKVDARATEVRTAIDQELIKLSVEESQAAYDELLAELKLKKTSQDSEMKILDLTRERHRRHRDRHANDVLKYTIRAPIDGMAVVQSVFRGGEFVALGDGDQVYPGQLLVKVVNPRNMQLEANVNQAESGDLKLGQSVTVGLDAFPGLTFPGKVYSMGAIAVSGRQGQYVRTIPVRIAIEGYEPRLIPDLSAYGDVLISQQETSTLVPLGAIREEDGKTIAYVKTGGSFEPRVVRLGKRNEIEATVISGLNPGEEVALNYVAAAAK